MKKKPLAPPFRALLNNTGPAYGLEWPQAEPRYPYDKETGAISLPDEVNQELLTLFAAGKQVEAIKRVLELTGAGLRMSKDYVDGLAAGKNKQKGKL